MRMVKFCYYSVESESWSLNSIGSENNFGRDVFYLDICNDEIYFSRWFDSDFSLLKWSGVGHSYFRIK